MLIAGVPVVGLDPCDTTGKSTSELPLTHP